METREWILVLLIAGLLYFQLKIFKGALKIVAGAVILAVLACFANYIFLPKLGMAPLPLGLDGFFRP